MSGENIYKGENIALQEVKNRLDEEETERYMMSAL